MAGGGHGRVPLQLCGRGNEAGGVGHGACSWFWGKVVGDHSFTEPLEFALKTSHVLYLCSHLLNKQSDVSLTSSIMDHSP